MTQSNCGTTFNQGVGCPSDFAGDYIILASDTLTLADLKKDPIWSLFNADCKPPFVTEGGFFMKIP